MRLLSTRILLEDMRFYANHGVMQQERIVGADFTVSLSIEVEKMESAIFNDQLSGTLDYSEVYAAVREEMMRPSALLENVAGRILSKLFAQFPIITEIEVKVSKVNPPMGADCKGASVVLKASRY